MFNVPLAMSFLLARTGTRRPQTDYARMLIFHGTPRRHATELERQLRYLSAQFEVVSLQALVASLGSPGEPLARRLAITFDDGLRNNITVAYPILQRLGLPATFFVCPGLIERGRWLWNQEVRQRLRSLGARARRALAAKVGAPPAVEGFVEWMKRLDLDSRQRVERRVRESTHDFTPSAQEREEFDLADWRELAQLDPAMVTIGSHTLTHPILTSLDERQTEVEIGESRRVIEKRLNRPADLFCYPNGEHSAAALQAARKHYRAAVVSTGPWVQRGCDPHLIPRLPMPPGGVLKLAWNVYP
jgi:peptidoglycan/xylan/chitin deacetylase (PgdA/CDA1 family)